jgi:hypothetical protein
MANYFSLRDGLITDTSTYGISISSIEKINNTNSYTLTTSDNWSTVLSSVNTDVIDSIAVHLNSRAATPVGVLSAQVSQYAGTLTKTGTTLSAGSPFGVGIDGSVGFTGVAASSFARTTTPIQFAGDFTIELWANFSVLGAANRMLCESWSGNVGWQLFYRDIGDSIAFFVNSTVILQDPSTTTIVANRWYHIAVTRQSGTVRLFIDGLLKASTTFNTNLVPTRPFNIGSQSAFTDNGFNGFISNLRIVDGTSLYNSNFNTSAPISPLTPLSIVPNTVFLYTAPYINAYKSSNAQLDTLVGTYPISSFTSYDGSNNSVANYPLNWQLLKLSSPFTNSSSFFSLNLKTSDADQLSLMALSTVNGVDYDRMAIKDSYTATTITDLHIGSVLSGFTTQNRAMTANTGNFGKLYIYKGGSLEFPITSTTLSVTGRDGLQVTSEGTLQIGTSSNPVPSNVTHQLNLSSNHLGVHNGGRLDVYGAYKVPYTKLTTPSLSTARVFTVTDAVSSNWRTNDTVVFTPNTAVSTSYDTLVLSSFDSDNTFRTTTSAVFAHSTLSYVPNVANMTRNVKIKGLSTTARGSIIANGNAVVNINNTEFSNISTNLVAGVFGNGSFSLSGCTLSGTGTENSFTFPETYYASVFNGTSTSIQAPANNSDFQVASGTDFTFEVFIKPAALTEARLVQFANFPWTTPTWDIGFSLNFQLTNNTISFNSLVGSTFNLLSASINLIKLNDWNHVAVVAKNGTSHLYINGILRHSLPQVTWNYNNIYSLNIGFERVNTASQSWYNGRMSNLRFVKGLAVYTSNFTPPTEPLKEITGAGISTAVLTLQDQLVVDNSSRRASLTRNNLTTVLDSPYFTRNAKNYYLNNNVCFKAQYGLNFQHSNQTNNTITNNLFLSSKDAGVYIKNLSSGSSVVINNNINVGPSRYGTYLEGNVSNTTIGNFVNYNNTTGLHVSGNNIGKINNVINTHNSLDGVNVNASTSNLSGLSFENIICNNNKADGFTVSGNNLNYLTPVNLNINGLTANNNSGYGIEAYNIIGSIKSSTIRDNIGNMNISIGNGPTTFDQLTSTIDVDLNLGSTQIFKPFTTKVGTINTVADTPYTNGGDYSRFSTEFTGNSFFSLNVSTTFPSLGISDFSFDADDDFTLETWVKFTSAMGAFTPLFIMGTGADSAPSHQTGWGLVITGTGTVISFYKWVAAGAAAVNSNTVTLTLNQWHHIAITRKSGLMKFWLNGVLVGSSQNVIAYPVLVSWPHFRIGGGFSSGGGTQSSLRGRMNGVRVLKNLALYDAPFVPSLTSPTFDINPTVTMLYMAEFGDNFANNFIKDSITANVNIISALNYNSTIFVDSIIKNNINAFNALKMDVNKLEEFRLQNCILSGGYPQPLKISTKRPKIEGSYLFYNCNSDIYNLKSVAINDYQSNTFTEAGISVINQNGLPETDTRYLAAGIISYDKTVKHTISNPASEKLEPLSDTIKLRSSSKLIPVNSGNTLTVSVYIKKSLNYTGSAPRLMMVGNSSLGYSDKVLATSTSPNDTWELLSGLMPTSTNKGIVEIYVDCSGLSGSGTINIDNWNSI